MCPAIVYGIVTGDVPVSYWLIFSLSLVTVPEVFPKVNFSFLSDKLAGTLIAFVYLTNRQKIPLFVH